MLSKKDHKAISIGNLNTVKRLYPPISNDIDTLLQILYPAVQFGQLQIIKYLVEEAKITIKLGANLALFRILNTAAEFGQLQIIKYLVEEANIAIEKDAYDESLSSAALYGRDEIIKYLMAQRNTVNYSPKEFGFVHMNAVRKAFENSHVDIIKYIVDEEYTNAQQQNLSLNQVNFFVLFTEPYDPLFIAKPYDQLSLLVYQYVVDIIKEDPNKSNYSYAQKFSGLFFAALSHDYAMVNYWLREGSVDFSCTNNQGISILDRLEELEHENEVDESILDAHHQMLNFARAHSGPTNTPDWRKFKDSLSTSVAENNDNNNNIIALDESNNRNELEDNPLNQEMTESTDVHNDSLNKVLLWKSVFFPSVASSAPKAPNTPTTNAENNELNQNTP